MNNDSSSSREINHAIEKALTDYFAATMSDPPDLMQRLWQHVAPWLTSAREGVVSANAPVAFDGNASLAPHVPLARNVNATIMRVIAAIITLLLIALFVSVLFPR